MFIGVVTAVSRQRFSRASNPLLRPPLCILTGRFLLPTRSECLPHATHHTAPTPHDRFPLGNKAGRETPPGRRLHSTIRCNTSRARVTHDGIYDKYGRH